MEFFNPSLLSSENLAKILEDRNLKIPNLRNLTKNELIKIYEKFALPLGQRASNSSQSSATKNDKSSSNKKDVVTSIQKTPIRAINLKRNFDQISKCDSSIGNASAKSIKLAQNKVSDKTNSDLNILNVQKRLSLDENSCNGHDEGKTKRPKITWP